MSILNGDDGYIPDCAMGRNEPELSPLEELEIKNAALEEALAEANKRSELNYGALQLLIKICRENKFDPFPGEDFPFKKSIKDLSREELTAKNEAAAVRIAETRGVDSKDKTPQPQFHVIEQKYATETPTFSESMEELLTKLEVQAIPDPQIVAPFERKIIRASSSDPYDPYSSER